MGELRLKDSAKPVLAKVRPVPYAEKPMAGQELDRQVNAGILMKDVPFQWSQECDIAFNKCEHAITGDQVVVHYDIKKLINQLVMRHPMELELQFHILCLMVVRDR